MKHEFVRDSLYAYESKMRAMSGDSKADRRVNLEFEGKGILPPYGETDFMEEASEFPRLPGGRPPHFLPHFRYILSSSRRPQAVRNAKFRIFFGTAYFYLTL